MDLGHMAGFLGDLCMNPIFTLLNSFNGIRGSAVEECHSFLHIYLNRYEY